MISKKNLRKLYLDIFYLFSILIYFDTCIIVHMLYIIYYIVTQRKYQASSMLCNNVPRTQ